MAKNDDKKKNLPQDAELAGMPVTSKGILLLVIAFGVMALGYVLMTGGGSDDPKVFSYAMFDFRRTVLAPLVILAGVALAVVGMMNKPKR